MQTLELNVCNIDMFGGEKSNFWMGDLRGVLEKYPTLEYPNRHNFYSILFIEEGQGQVEIDNRTIRIESSKVVVVKPRSICKIDINQDAKGKMVCFTKDFFSLRYNNNILDQFSFLKRDANEFIRLTKDDLAHWKILLNLFEGEYILQKKETKNILRSYLNILLFELDRYYVPVVFTKSTNVKVEKIHVFEELIEQHFQTKKFPSDYAEMMNITANYLNKICKEETGQTSGDLIRKRIMVEAKRLLHYTNDAINEIADKLGFENTSYFITFFKKEAEFTPEYFRKLKNT
jgi:AraC-like DNA-binding protein